MISLTKRLKQETEGGAGSRGSNGIKKGGGQANGTSRASIRDKLLVKEVRNKRERKFHKIIFEIVNVEVYSANIKSGAG
jgi:hypothetical protein